MKANQESILELIQEGKLDHAIKCFLEVTRQHDKSLYNQGILQSANFNSLKTDVINSMLSPEQANIRRSRIGFFMTELVGKLDPTWEVEVNLIAKKPVQEKESPKTSAQVTKKILFLAANPINLTQIGTGREA